MLDCGPEFDIIRAAVEENSSLGPYDIMAKYIAFDERPNIRSSGSRNPAGIPKPGGRGGGGGGQNGRGAGNMLDGGVLAVAAAETRACYNCKETGHLEKDCPKHSEEVRKVLNAIASRPRKPFKPRGKRN